MSQAISLEIFRDIVPGGLAYGANYLVEYEPESLWYETSLSLAADALLQGIRTDYHTFTHIPDEIRTALARVGVSVQTVEEAKLFRILDSFNVTTGLGVQRPSRKDRTPYQTKSLDLDAWAGAALHEIRHGVPEIEKRRLHIDDSLSVLAQYNSEKSIVDYWRTKFLTWSRSLELCILHSLAMGIHTESFYKHFETICDGIIDVKSQEEQGSVQHYLRVRTIRGRNVISKWQKLKLSETGLVAVVQEPIETHPGQHLDSSLLGAERRLSAIMFTDIVGFTSLAEENEPLALELLEEHRKLLRPLFPRYNGKEIKTVGDMFLVEFASALEAVRCAVQIQKSLSNRNIERSKNREILLRIGIHVGDVEHNLGDVYGDAVNIASRIEPLAKPGGIVITRPVFEQIRSRPGIEMQSLGLRELKNVKESLEVFSIAT